MPDTTSPARKTGPAKIQDQADYTLTRVHRDALATLDLLARNEARSKTAQIGIIIGQAAALAARKKKLIDRLKNLSAQDQDPEAAHSYADDALLDFIEDPEIRLAYHGIAKWYA